MPWEQFTAGGAALLVTGILVYVLKHTSQMSREHNETIAKVTNQFTTTVKDATKSFEETVTMIHRESRESHERREHELHALIREVARGQLPGPPPNSGQ